jgi:hypothetical protein
VEADPGGDTMVVPPDALADGVAAHDAEPRPAADARRVRIVLAGLFLLALAAALVVWGLSR